MFQLLLVVLAIFLLAAVATAGVNYINFDGALRQASVQTVSTGFLAWERAYAAFRIANRSEPVQVEDLASFMPSDAPRAPRGLTWGFGRDAAGAYICLQGVTNSQSELAALVRLADRSSSASAIPPESVVYGESCGVPGQMVLGWPLAVTYRLN
jgi:hypothetical protein